MHLVRRLRESLYKPCPEDHDAENPRSGGAIA